MLRLSTIALSLSLTLLGAGALSLQSASAEEEILIDAVVASVSGKPITLQEVNARLTPPRALGLKEASLDAEAREVLEAIILDRLIVEDAAAKHISVSDAEISSYIDEVVKRNQLTRAEFEVALAREGRTLDSYSQRIKIDILRSKIIGQYIQGSISVSQEEVSQYLEEHPKLKQGGAKLKLSQILIGTSAGQEQAQARIAEIQARLAKGEDFSALAREYSESPEGKEGGSLGMLAEQDLGPQVFDAVFALTPGQVSTPVTTASSIQLFRVDSRHAEAGESAQGLAVEEAKATIRQQKVNEKMFSYFNSELPKLYAVEKKI